LGIGDWGLGIGDWAQSPIPNPQSPIPNPQLKFSTKIFILNLILLIMILFKIYLLIIDYINIKYHLSNIEIDHIF